MPLVACKCPSCNADLDFDDSREIMFCSYCGTKVVKEQIVNISVLNGAIIKNEDWYYKNIIGLFKKGEYQRVCGLVEKFFDEFPLGEFPGEVQECVDYSEDYFSLQTTPIFRYKDNGGFTAFVNEQYATSNNPFSKRNSNGTFPIAEFERCKDSYLQNIDRYCEIYGCSKEDILNDINQFELRTKLICRSINGERESSVAKEENARDVKIGFYIVIGIIILMGLIGSLT